MPHLSPAQLQLLRDALQDSADAPQREAARALLAQLPIAVFLTDRQGRLVYANAEACRHVAELPDAVGTVLGRVLLTGEAIRDEEVEMTTPEGGRRWASVSITAIVSPRGDVEGAVLTMADVTDRRRADAWVPVMESLSRL